MLTKFLNKNKNTAVATLLATTIAKDKNAVEAYI